MTSAVYPNASSNETRQLNRAIDGCLGRGLSKSEWKNELENVGVHWDKKKSLVDAIVLKEYTFFRTEIEQLCKSNPNTVVLRRLKGKKKWLKRSLNEEEKRFIQNENEKRYRQQRLFTQDASDRTFDKYVEKWGIRPFKGTPSVINSPDTYADGRNKESQPAIDSVLELGPASSLPDRTSPSPRICYSTAAHLFHYNHAEPTLSHASIPNFSHKNVMSTGLSGAKVSSQSVQITTEGPELLLEVDRSNSFIPWNDDNSTRATLDPRASQSVLSPTFLKVNCHDPTHYNEFKIHNDNTAAAWDATPSEWDEFFNLNEDGVVLPLPKTRTSCSYPKGLRQGDLNLDPRIDDGQVVRDDESPRQGANVRQHKSSASPVRCLPMLPSPYLGHSTPATSKSSEWDDVHIKGYFDDDGRCGAQSLSDIAYAQAPPTASTLSPKPSSPPAHNVAWEKLVIEQHDSALGHECDTEMPDLDHTRTSERVDIYRTQQNRPRPEPKQNTSGPTRRLSVKRQTRFILLDKLRAKEAELQRIRDDLQSRKKESDQKDQKIYELELKIKKLEQSVKRTSLQLMAGEETTFAQRFQQSAGHDLLMTDQLPTLNLKQQLSIIVAGHDLTQIRSCSLDQFLPHRPATSSGGSHCSSRGNSPGPSQIPHHLADVVPALGKELCLVEKTGYFFKNLGQKISKNSLKDHPQHPEDSCKVAMPAVLPMQHPTVDKLVDVHGKYIEHKRDDSGYASMQSTAESFRASTDTQ